MDCSHEFGNRGCYGGMVNWAFKYVKENGLQTEDSYPFEATVSGTLDHNNGNTSNFAFNVVPNCLSRQQLSHLLKFILSNELNTSPLAFSLQDGTCRYNPASVEATSTGYVDIIREDEDALQEAVATIGPISVAISTSHESFRFYESGESHAITYTNRTSCSILLNTLFWTLRVIFTHLIPIEFFK